jgi:hypothetical protein
LSYEIKNYMHDAINHILCIKLKTSYTFVCTIYILSIIYNYDAKLTYKSYVKRICLNDFTSFRWTMLGFIHKSRYRPIEDDKRIMTIVCITRYNRKPSSLGPMHKGWPVKNLFFLTFYLSCPFLSRSLSVDGEC